MSHLPNQQTQFEEIVTRLNQMAGTAIYIPLDKHKVTGEYTSPTTITAWTLWQEQAEVYKVSWDEREAKFNTKYGAVAHHNETLRQQLDSAVSQIAITVPTGSQLSPGDVMAMVDLATATDPVKESDPAATSGLSSDGRMLNKKETSEDLLFHQYRSESRVMEVIGKLDKAISDLSNRVNALEAVPKALTKLFGEGSVELVDCSGVKSLSSRPIGEQVRISLGEMSIPNDACPRINAYGIDDHSVAETDEYPADKYAKFLARGCSAEAMKAFIDRKTDTIESPVIDTVEKFKAENTTLTKEQDATSVNFLNTLMSLPIASISHNSIQWALTLAFPNGEQPEIAMEVRTQAVRFLSHLITDIQSVASMEPLLTDTDVDDINYHYNATVSKRTGFSAPANVTRTATYPPIAKDVPTAHPEPDFYPPQ